MLENTRVNSLNGGKINNWALKKCLHNIFENIFYFFDNKKAITNKWT